MESSQQAALRSLAYRFLATLYLAPPQPEWLATLVREGLLDEFPVPLGNAQMQEGQRLLVAACREPEFAALTADYQQLFIGPNHLPAPPWESVYRTEERLVFDWPTLEVRAAYQEMGLSVSDTTEPDDHIGLELLFMATLAERQAAGDLRAAAAQAAFLKRHLLVWAPTFCADLAASAATSLYKGLALLTQGMLAQETELLAIA
jgi:TorA maturation chaperone TorD